MSELINFQIRAREVLVIGENGEKLGVMSRNAAINLAAEKNLDLMLVAERANPPVCKIVDYGKYKYEQKKKQKESKANATIIKVKTVKCKPTIEKGDLQIRANKAIKFLEHGDRVHFRVMVFGRYHQKKDWIVENVVKQFIEMTKDYGKIEGSITMEKDIDMMIVPLKK